MRNRNADADRDRPVPGDAERRQDDQDDQQAHLEPEAAEPRAALGVERLALVGDRANRGGLFGGGHDAGERVPPVTPPHRRGRRLTRSAGRAAAWRAAPMTHPACGWTDRAVDAGVDRLASRGRPRAFDLGRSAAPTELIGSATPPLRAPRRPARRPGRRRSTGSTTRRWSARWACRPATRSCAATYFGETGEPGRGARRPAAAPGRPRRVRRADRAAHAQQLPPARAQLLHAAAAGRLDRRRGARPVDQPGHRRLARRAGRRVRRGGGRPLAVRPRRVRRGQLRAAGVGRRDGELHRDGARPRRPPPRAHGRRPARRAAPRSRASASTPATRPTSRSRGRSTSSASRPRRWSSSRPTTASASTPRPSPRRSRATGRPACGPSPSPPSPARRTRARSTSSRSSRRSPRREGLWLHVDAAYGGAARLSARDAGRVPGLHLADSVTIDPHKWFFQAYDVGALLVRDGAPPAPDVRPLARVLPRRRGTGGGRGRTRDAHDAHAGPAQLLQARASRAPGGSARSSCGRRGSTSGRAASAG